MLFINFSGILSLLTLLSLSSYGVNALPLEDRANGISQSIYDNLVRFAKFSSAAYQLVCPRPLGTTLVNVIDKSDTEGFVARDDDRKEIIVSIRGTFSIGDAITDIQLLMSPLQSPGITGVGDSYVHTGFLNAYNVVANDVVAAVKSQLASKPSYTVVVTGHSLGAAVAALAALGLKSALPSANLKLYTYGQPRVGNAAFVSLVESRVGVANIFRATHTYDGVPTVLFKATGYRHFGTEFWNFQEAPSAANTRQCALSDDPTCSDSIPSTFINPAHLVYFGQPMALNPLLCLF
ncbi:hypothetical protein D9611_013235 [Ephemerocybe angulata]|uniref:Fungal lipase-type domain-containing protein n=1 Tax=Ephemerocybe angulata TaxID=980116 RepID=A0A8H5CAX1_9AGAR|nr:hypothetical protein D9611_013235 [Tulosesus angulatus]